MNHIPTFFRLAALALVTLAANVAFAHPFYADRVPNRALETNGVGEDAPCITCHNNPNGGAGCTGGAALACGETGTSAPCLNAFGLAFRSNGFMWDASLGALDSDGDGFTNGEELQDPSGAWNFVLASPGNADYVTQPGCNESTPGSTDGDGDGFCWFGQDLDGSGECLGEGENNGARDCDDESRSVNSGAEEDCTSDNDANCDGLPTRFDAACVNVVDRDGDTFCPMGRDRNRDGDCIDSGERDGSVDCNDDAPTVFPGALENCIDMLDNNCDDAIDRDDAQCYRNMDMDGDGYCPIGIDLNDNGTCTDPAESCTDEAVAAGECVDDFTDCNDSDLMSNPDQVEDCTDGLDNNCDGFPDFLDVACRDFFDQDGDGHCAIGFDDNGDGDCTDEGEPEGPSDCDETNAFVSPSSNEICTNDIDDDCDMAVSLMDADCAGYLDQDGDGWCFVGSDKNGDGDCADTELMEEGGGADCNDDPMDPFAALANPSQSEGSLRMSIAFTCDSDRSTLACTSPSDEACATCFNGFDDNCDGSPDGEDPACAPFYFDGDGDGYCFYGIDSNGDGACDDEGELFSADEVGDCSPTNPNISPAAGENCIDFRDNDQDGAIDRGFEGAPADDECVADVDADGDGYCPIGQDLNGDGDCLDEGENRRVSDCDESDPERHPGAVEICNNGDLDDDCDGEYDLRDPDCDRLKDGDNDGYCPDGIDDNRDGDCTDTNEERGEGDCDDSEVLARPLFREFCDDGIDNDCDGATDVEDDQCACTDDALCDDGDPCTRDACNPDGFGCFHEPDASCGMSGDAGMGSDADMGGGGDDGGCGCRTGGERSAPYGLLAAFGLALFLRRRKQTH